MSIPLILIILVMLAGGGAFYTGLHERFPGRGDGLLITVALIVIALLIGLAVWG
jgi:hypothetical protein